MTDFGLTKHGFRPKRYSDIISEKESRARELFGNDINLSESSPLGMLVRLNAWDEALVWQRLEEVYLSGFVSTAEGITLDRKCQDIGISRQLSRNAYGKVLFSGTNRTQVFQGFNVQTATGIVFRTIEAGEIINGSVLLDVEAIEPGITGNVGAGLINKVVSSLSGLTSVSNPEATLGGRDTETDAQLRDRYIRSVAKPGGASNAAIEAALLNIDGVVDAIVRQNETMELDAITGIPAKSIAPIVFGGDAADITSTLFEVKPAGIQCWGDITHTIPDSHGNDHYIGFTRPETVEINVTIGLTVDPLVFPVDGTQTVKTIIETYISGFGLGDDVIYTRLMAQIHKTIGIIDIPILKVNNGITNISIPNTAVAIPGDIEVTVL